jgi:hypothetical protein
MQRLTYGELLNPFMGITEEDEAQERFDFFVEYIHEITEVSGKAAWVAAQQRARADICTYAEGYFSGDDRDEKCSRVRDLFAKREYRFLKTPAPVPVDPFQRFAFIPVDDD